MADRLFEPEISRSLRFFSVDRPERLPVNLALECKKCTKPYLEMDRVKDHQIQGLLEFQDFSFSTKMATGAAPGKMKRRFQIDTPFDFLMVSRGKGYLLVNFRFTKNSPRKDLPKGLNECYAVNVVKYLDAEATLDPRKSVPYEWFKEHGIEIERMKMSDGKYGWDLRPLFR